MMEPGEDRVARLYETVYSRRHRLGMPPCNGGPDVGGPAGGMPMAR